MKTLPPLAILLTFAAIHIHDVAAGAEGKDVKKMLLDMKAFLIKLELVLKKNQPSIYSSKKSALDNAQSSLLDASKTYKGKLLRTSVGSSSLGTLVDTMIRQLKDQKTRMAGSSAQGLATTYLETIFSNMVTVLTDLRTAGATSQISTTLISRITTAVGDGAIIDGLAPKDCASPKEALKEIRDHGNQIWQSHSSTKNSDSQKDWLKRVDDLEDVVGQFDFYKTEYCYDSSDEMAFGSLIVNARNEFDRQASSVKKLLTVSPEDVDQMMTAFDAAAIALRQQAVEEISTLSDSIASYCSAMIPSGDCRTGSYSFVEDAATA